MQQWLVEAGLVLVRHDEDAVAVLAEKLGKLLFGEATVHARFGVLFAVDDDLSREGDECLRMTELAHVLSPQLLVRHAVAHRRLAARRDDHGFRPAAEVALHLAGEVVHDDAQVAHDGAVIGRDEVRELPFCGGGFEFGIVWDGLDHLAERVVGGVIGRDVEDETLFDGLPHRIEVERLLLPLRIQRAEHVERPARGGGGEAYDGDVLLAP